MATKLASNAGSNQHTSGIFADMTLDGPEIGTLVLVVDRAKNLPNRKTMGKQNPYCAARLGKEAKKTETDRRGGQTPKWDQELRFTVHDSLDFHTLKVSIFSEDKRTDLIGEAWVSLKDVVVPGGGKRDLWQGMNYKGKYAGELRIELTYYDTRPRPETVGDSVAAAEDFRHSTESGTSRVKRRPLPSNPAIGQLTPDAIPDHRPHPGRAKHGPREYSTPPRANSMPPEVTSISHARPAFDAPVPKRDHIYSTPPNQCYGEYNPYHESDEAQEFEAAPYGHSQVPPPDFLPQLPPSSRQRSSLPPQPRIDTRPVQPPSEQPRPPIHAGLALAHSQSAPSVPTTHPDLPGYDNYCQLQTDYPEPLPDLDYQHQQLSARPLRVDASPAWQNGSQDFAWDAQAHVLDVNAGPPPPPMHSNSAPSVPHHRPGYDFPSSSPMSAYGATPPSARYPSVPNSSPSPHIERRYGTPQNTPPNAVHTRGMSVDSYTPPPRDPRGYGNLPSSLTPGQPPSPYARPPPPPQPLPNRHSIADPCYTTPPRPHPLSQELPRPRSPQPFHPQEQPGSSPHPNGHLLYQQEHNSHDVAPLIKPRAVSPRPSPASSLPNSASQLRNSYSLQFPIRAFESADNCPLSTSQSNQRPPQTSDRLTPVRKSISPHPSPPNSAGAMPFSPDSFDVHNPNARPVLANGTSPHSPYQVKPGSTAVPLDTNGPIVGWNGQEIDPSDHLPVDSWAPEPEKKTPTKMYGLGRDRDFGPRSALEGGSRSVGKDTLINVRLKPQSQPQPQAEQTPSRNRLQKKSGPIKSPPVEPLREHHNFNSVSIPDPYAQQEYGRALYEQSDRGNGYAHDFAPSPTSYISPPPSDALAREISNIDLGSRSAGRRGSVPAPAAYVPVRSHRDRRTFY